MKTDIKTPNRKTAKNAAQSMRGFTLIEVAIALLVIGLIAAPLVQQYHQFIKIAQQDTTEANLNLAYSAISQFYFEFDRYPCPADPKLGPADATYGEEDCTAASLSVIPVMNIDGNPGIDNIWVGMVPFKTLKMTPEETLDAWSNKLNYAVTDVLAQPPVGGFNQGWGLITIHQDDTRGLLPDTCGGGAVDTNGVHLALYSSGPDEIGAYPAQNMAAPPQACPALGTTKDAENCQNNDEIFLFPTCIKSQVAGANHYDDIFLTRNAEDFMALAPQKMFDTATNPNDVGTTAGYIGINNNDPQSELDIIGNIRASDEFGNPDKQGEAHASEYCDTAGNNCFKAESIAGNDPNMNCIGSKGMSGIGSNKAKCSEIIPSFTTATTCPAGQYVSGISSTGVITCATP